MSPLRMVRLFEREGELNRLEDAIGAARDGIGTAVLIEGAAGIGKTALLAAACERGAAAGMNVLSARAGELEREFAWGVVRQLFEATVARAGARRDAELLAEAAQLARPALGLEALVGAADVSYAILHGLYWLTVNLAQRQPLVLATDDLQWVDNPSLRFLAHLLPRLGELPAVVLLTSRPQDSEPGSDDALRSRLVAERDLIALRPDALSAAASTELVRHELSAEANADFCRACYDVSGGNPFLLRELIADLAAEQIEPSADAIDHVRRISPETVSRSVLVRLARLPAESLALARAVAVLGASAQLRRAQLLAELDPDRAAAAAAALVRAGILSGADTVAFVHPLVRSAIYGDLAGPERARWHGRAAGMLARDKAPPEQIAPHLLAAPASGDASTVAQLREAAADAWARGAPEIAAGYLSRALAEPPEDRVRSEVLSELGRIEAAYNPAAAIPHLRAALDESVDGGQRVAGALALGDALFLIGEFGEAITVLDRGIEAHGQERSEILSSLEATRLSAARWDAAGQDRRRTLVEQLRRRAANDSTPASSPRWRWKPRRRQPIARPRFTTLARRWQPSSVPPPSAPRRCRSRFSPLPLLTYRLKADVPPRSG